MKVKSESELGQSCPTLRDSMDCSLPSSSVHGIFQARVLEWAAIAFSDHQPLEECKLKSQPDTTTCISGQLKNKIIPLTVGVYHLKHCSQGCKMVQTLWKPLWQILKRGNLQLTDDLVIEILGIYCIKDLNSHKKCTKIFIVTSFEIDHNWRQSKSFEQVNV